MDESLEIARIHLPAKGLLDDARRVLIATHLKPDGDAVGSSLALAAALTARGKDCWVVCPDDLPAAFGFLPGSDGVLSGNDPLPGARPDLIVTIDSGSLDQLGRVYSENASLFQAVPILNIDHHRTNTRYGVFNIVDLKAAATAETVYLLLRGWGFDVSPQMATSLLFAIVTDTQGFRTHNTTARTLRLSAELMERGASISAVNDAAFRRKPFSMLKLWGRVFDQMRRDGPIAWSRVTRRMLAQSGAGDHDTDSAVSYLADVEGVELAILFRETANGSIRVSLRSTPEVDVGSLAASFGGGGHRQAAGCTLDGPIDEAEEVMLAAAKEHLAAHVGKGSAGDL